MTLNGPQGSHLYLISELPDYGSYDRKVRFLGCVENYDIATGIIAIGHAYPPNRPNVLAKVDVNGILGTLQRNTTQVGAWVRVMGYIQQADAPSTQTNTRDPPTVQVAAIILSAASPFPVEVYEKAMRERLELLEIGKSMLANTKQDNNNDINR
ncbi:MAG: hypothetical protein M1814_005391 [Vezdaea aestivalis]|nr:MAG: hypothetical protein M1814_005391 [Vezdaea aestivalis]